MSAVLIVGGIAVNRTFFSEYTLSNEGTLYSFRVNPEDEKYVYYSTSQLLHPAAVGTRLYGKEDKIQGLPGYYQRSVFSDFNLGLKDIELLGTYKYNEWVLAVDGDIIEVPRLSPGYTGTESYQFEDYFRKAVYTFKKAPMLYLDYSRISNFPPIDLDPLSANYSVKTPVFSDFSDNYTGLFYAKNFGDLVNDWDIPNVSWGDDNLNSSSVNLKQENISKYQLAYKMTLICWKIYHIKEDILQIIAIEDVDHIISCYKNYILEEISPSSEDSLLAAEYEEFSLIDRMIGFLCKSWGMLSTGESIIEFEPILPLVPDIRALENYLYSLKTFYQELKYSEEFELFPVDLDGEPVDNEGNPLTLNQDSDRRIRSLLRIFSPEAITTLPRESRIYWLEYFFNKEYPSDFGTFINQFGPSNGYYADAATERESDERTAVSIIGSFRNTIDSQYLLDYLLKNDGLTTKFEVLYNKLSDARLERYPFISWFVDRQTNRKFFIYLLYEIWKISNYNFYHIPVGTEANSDEINPDSYWFTSEGKEFFPEFDDSGELISGNDPLMEFVHEKVTHSYSRAATGIRYEPEKKLDKVKVIVNQVVYDIVATGNDIGPYFEEDINETKLYGTYHLYQPIVLLGYEADLDLYVPNFSTIPAFLFYYAIDYDKIKDFDAALVFSIEVGVEIALFFLTGGSSAVKHLRHLKHITKLFKVKNAYGTMSAAEKVLFWRGFEVGTEIVAVPASLMHSYFNYEVSTSNDPAVVELNKKLSSFFLYLTFSSAGLAITSRYRCVKSSKEVLKEIDDLSTNGIIHTVPDKVMDVIYTVRNSGNVSRVEFRNHISGIAPVHLGGEMNHIGDIFDSLTELEKSEFWRHFGHRTRSIDNYFWQTMNSAEGKQMLIWKEIKFFRNLRRKIPFLKIYDLVVNHIRIPVHVFQGHFGVTPTGRAYVNGMHNPFKIDGVNWRWAPGETVIENSRGYKYGKIERNFANDDPPWIGGNLPTSWKRKSDATGIWPKFHADEIENTRRINEEMAFALSNCKFIQVTNFRGNPSGIYHGVASDGQTIEIIFDMTTKNLKFIYPINITN